MDEELAHWVDKMPIFNGLFSNVAALCGEPMAGSQEIGIGSDVELCSTCKELLAARADAADDGATVDEEWAV